jgi:acetoin utilization protein AcuB
MITIKDIMVKGVIIVKRDYTLETIEKIMVKKNIGHVFVVAENKLTGIVSDGDIKRRKSFLAGTDIANFREENTLKIKAHQIMTRELITLNPDSPIVEAVDLMLHNDIHIIPIVEPGNKLVGIVSTSDLLRLLKGIIEHKK